MLLCKWFKKKKNVQITWHSKFKKYWFVLTVLQASANACNWLFSVLLVAAIRFPALVRDGTTAGEQTVVVACVVVVRLMQVLMDGIIGTGIGIAIVTIGCGFEIGPQACLCRLNSANQSNIAFLKALLGWYIFSGSVGGMSSEIPSSVSVSNLISADTLSSKKQA